MIETEVKIRWNGTVEEARALLVSRGYQAVAPRTLESDQLFDRPAPGTGSNATNRNTANANLPGELQSSGQVLRLRRSSPAEPNAVKSNRDSLPRATVTYKGPAENQTYKSREEIEFDCSDADAFELVLKRLGYYPGFRYEKYRSVFASPAKPNISAANIGHLIRNGAGIITLDETPIGLFLELEGAADWIDETARQLGFTSADYVTDSYAKLYREYRRSHPAIPADMIFALMPPVSS